MQITINFRVNLWYEYESYKGQSFNFEHLKEFQKTLKIGKMVKTIKH